MVQEYEISIFNSFKVIIYNKNKILKTGPYYFPIFNGSRIVTFSMCLIFLYQNRFVQWPLNQSNKFSIIIYLICVSKNNILFILIFGANVLANKM